MYLAFGDRKDIIRQILFSILSVRRLMQDNVEIAILTDSPTRFSFAKPHSTIIKLNAETIRNWSGPHEFMWRIKIKAIEKSVELFPDSHILYLDSDTVLVETLSTLNDALSKGMSLMHVSEGMLSKSKGSAQKNINKHLANRSFASYPFSSKTEMYNAGVIGLPAFRAKQLIKDCIDVCDLLCATKADRTYLEQLSFSMVLSDNDQIHLAEKEIMHYWGSKSIWDELIAEFICDSFYEQRNQDLIMKEFSKIELRELPIKFRRQNWNIKFKKAADKLFPRLRVEHFD